MENFSWFRRLKGGKWYFYKLGKDTPPINMFCIWSQESPEHWDMKFCTLLDVETYRIKRK